MDKNCNLPLSGREMLPPIGHEPMCKIEDFGETDYVKKVQDGATNGFWSILKDFDSINNILLCYEKIFLIFAALINGMI